VSETFPLSALETHLTDILRKNRPVHFLPPYRPKHRHRLGTLLGLQHDRVDTYASVPLVRTVVQQRLRKTKSEVQQLDTAVDVSATMHEAAMQLAEPGRTEREIAGRLAGISEAQGRGLSFRPTCSIHGEVLHNHNYSNELSAGDLLLVDAGATSPEQYAGDITRVTPVGGSFSPRQRAVYQGVLAAQRAAIDAIAPDVPFRDIHLLAARILTEHLIEMGLMKGDADAAVAAGAHALFFPHGLGHMLGLDVHDMENLGEDIVGYASDQTRSDQFGLHTLRLARPLEPGYVVTVEPGCYFIPELIRQWRSDDRHAEFIDYEAVESFADFGGIRIEDDVLVTKEGAEILGPGVPKTIDDVESRTGTAPPSP
jgi:Xaa-Pro aminopeptidase